MINWSSCVSLLKSKASNCILECQPKLAPLFKRSFPNVQIRASDRRKETKQDNFDYHLPAGDLYEHFLPEIAQKLNANSFLIPDPIRVQYWRTRLESLGAGPFVGISWKSSNNSPMRSQSYAQIRDLSPIFAIESLTLINLQSSGFLDELAEIKNSFDVPIHNFEDLDHWDDLDEVAALCAALDVVVSVHTTVASIAAGVGTPTKVMVWAQDGGNNFLNMPTGPIVKKFERNTWERLDAVFHKIAQNIVTQI
jgi:hypothetical protein